MDRLIWTAAAAGLAAMMAVSPARAGITDREDWRLCTYDDDIASDARIAGCTAFIRSGEGGADDRADAYIRRGGAHATQGELYPAIVDYGHAIAIDPEPSYAFAARCWAYLRLQRYARAVVDCDAAIRLNDVLAGALVDRASAYVALGQPARAIADLDKAVALDPQHWEAFGVRAMAYYRLGDVAAADRDSEQALDLNPDAAEVLNNRCAFHAEGNVQLAAALADCNGAVRLRPDEAAFLDSLAFAHFRLGNFAAAILFDNDALMFAPDLATALYVRGLAKRKSGDAAGGKADIAAATALDAKIVDTYAAYGVMP